MTLQHHGKQVESAHMIQLDGLRIIAVLMVLVNHWTGWSLPLFNGRVGVILFFLLSGFLITGILLDNRAHAEQLNVPRRSVLWSFYGRRFLRIFPVYYVVLFIASLFGFLEVSRYIFWHMAYLSNVLFTVQSSWMGDGAHLWSLSVEEQFYIIWPTIILFIPRRWLLPSIIAAIAIAPVTRWAIMQFWGNTYAVWTLTFCLLDALCLGALLAFLKRRSVSAQGTVRTIVYTLTWLGVGLFWGLKVYLQYEGWNPQIWDIASDTFIALMMLGVVYSASEGDQGPLGWLLSLSPVVYLGRISYAIYVVHNFVPKIFWKIAAILGVPETLIPPPMNYILYLVATIAISVISWHLFESKINGLKRYIPYLPSGKESRSAMITSTGDDKEHNNTLQPVEPSETGS